MAFKRIMKDYKQLLEDTNYYFSVCMNDILNWNFIMLGPEDTIYEGGIFKGTISFPKNYPHSPPKVKFLEDMIHPNIYKDGNVCISIVHEGTDQYGYENTKERWGPSQNINTIMLSILSLLSDPNFESPANVDVNILYKNNKELYKKQIYNLVHKSQI